MVQGVPGVWLAPPPRKPPRPGTPEGGVVEEPPGVVVGSGGGSAPNSGTFANRLVSPRLASAGRIKASSCRSLSVTP